MNNQLDCAVARDLLPLYAEHLVSEPTAALLREHLADCPACSEALRRMETEVSLQMPKPAASEKQVLRRLTGLRLWYLLCPLIAFVLLYLGLARALSVYLGVLGVVAVVGLSSQFLSGMTMGGIDYEQAHLREAAEKRSRRKWGGYYASPLQIVLPALLAVAVVLVQKIVRFFTPELQNLPPSTAVIMLLLPVALVLLFVLIHVLNKRLPK